MTALLEDAVKTMTNEQLVAAILRTELSQAARDLVKQEILKRLNRGK